AFRLTPFSRSRENPLLPLERQLLSGLFHCRFEAQDGLQTVEAGVGIGRECPQRAPLYEPPAAASNRGPEGRRALQFEGGERPALVRYREEPKHAIVVGDLLPDPRQAAMEARGPV